MSLLEELYETFKFVDKVRVSDGEGGYSTQWRDGASFQAIATMDTSMQAKIAESQGVTSIYTITTKKATNLAFMDVVKRVSDGKIFRVTSDGSDNKTPASAGLDIRQVSAERWDLTT